MSSGFADLLRTFKNPRLVLFMAWSDVRARYKRSVLGPFWITISTAIGVVGLGLVWSELFKLDRSVYVPMLSVGLILWQFLSSSIMEASVIYTRQSSLIRNLNLPISFYPSQLLLRQLINLAHTVPLYFLVIWVLDSPLNANALWAIPGLCLVVLNLYWMIMLVGVLGARFRDLEYIVNTIMPLMMFFTPVLYRADALPFSAKLIWLNPLAHMIEIIRDPLLGSEPKPIVVYTNIGLLIFGMAITLFLFNKKRDRVAMWV